MITKSSYSFFNQQRNSKSGSSDIKIIAGDFSASEWGFWGECQVTGSCGRGVRFRENSRLRSDSEICYKICDSTDLFTFSNQMPGKIRASCPNDVFCVIAGEYKMIQAGAGITYEKINSSGSSFKLQYLEKGSCLKIKGK